MKKLLLGIFATLTCFGMMAACGDNGATSSPESSNPTENSSPESSAPLHEHEKDLNDVKDYLQGLIANKTLDTRVNYTVINSYSFFGEEAKYDIAWSTDVEGVTIEEGEAEDTVVIAELEEDTPYVLTATISDPEGCHSIEISFDGVALKALTVIPEAITSAPVAGTAYKYHVYQSTLAKDMYFAGEMDGYYFKTTEIGAEGVDVYVEYKEGSTTEFYPYFTHAENGKQYIGVRLSEDGAHDNIVYASEPVTVFVWNETLGTITTHLDKNKNGEAADYYLGNYSTHKTISASMLSYAGGAGNNVGHLVTLIDKSAVPANEKVAFEKEALNVTAEVTGDKTIELAVKGIRYSEVAITWAVAGENATLEGNVLTIANPAADTTVTLTATLTCGDVTETKEFTIASKHVAVNLTNAEIVNAAYALAPGATLGDYTLTGVISEIGDAYSEQFKNITVTIIVENMTDKPIVCYRMKSGAADASTVKVGDTITVSGTLLNYSKDGSAPGLVEFTSGCVLDSIGGASQVPGATEEEKAIVNQLYALAAGESATGPFTVTGVITVLDKYNNPTIVVGDMTDKPIYCYKLKDDSFAVGKTITVTAQSMKNYNGTYEFMDCTLVTGEAPETPDEPETPEKPELVIPEGASSASVVMADYAAANAWENGTLYESVKVNDDITVSCVGTPTGNYGRNTGKYYTDGATWRIYQSENATLTVTAAEGKTIVSVIVTYLSHNDGVLTLNNENVVSDAIVSVNGASVTFNIGNTGTKTNGQARITAIQVIYA